MGIFRFKKFSVKNGRSAMKVNTDGVLLGAVMRISADDCFLLDVGTGTGTIALMAAQRCADLHAGKELLAEGIMIDSIDIDEASVLEARDNFSCSPWGESLHAFHCSLEDFAAQNERKYDLIFSNPPYFDCSLMAPEQRRNAARHTSCGLSYRELAEFASERLAPDGRLAIVLPADQENALLRHARMCGLFPQRLTRVKTVPRKKPSRFIAEFSRTRCDVPEECLLSIQDEGEYTSEYISLTRDFYLQF